MCKVDYQIYKKLDFPQAKILKAGQGGQAF